jgi:hypothetical protein
MTQNTFHKFTFSHGIEYFLEMLWDLFLRNSEVSVILKKKIYEITGFYYRTFLTNLLFPVPYNISYALRRLHNTYSIAYKFTCSHETEYVLYKCNKK